MIKFTRYVMVFAMFMAASIPVADAADEAVTLEEEIQSLKKGQEQIQKDLAEIKKLLQEGARAAPGQQGFSARDTQLGDVAYMGEKDAVVTLIEFSDYQCPFCKRHATTVMPTLIESYIDTGKVRYVMREFPILSLHARAEAASMAALCAGEQGKYWAMHDALFNDQKANTDESFQLMAEGLELDLDNFFECTTSKRYKEQISADQVEGQKMGISGTPSFVLGLTDPDDPDTVHLSKFIRGAQPLPTFAVAIDELLESAEAAE